MRNNNVKLAFSFYDVISMIIGRQCFVIPEHELTHSVLINEPVCIV